MSLTLRWPSNCATDNSPVKVQHFEGESNVNVDIKRYCLVNDFVTQKVYFSRIMRVYVGLIMLAACTVQYLVQVSLTLIGQQGMGHFFRYRPLLRIGWRTVPSVRELRRKMTFIQLQPLLAQCKQQANSLLSMHNYTPLAISGNDKNKQLTL